ncbi:MAG: O-antigen ligase family protein [Acidobacteriota bacterium]|nr:O-antigen ligase family protein [Acidobacteriota bacterium]
MAYQAIVLFSLVYFLRPEDFIPKLAFIPMNKIVAGIALLALIFGARPKNRQKLPTELKVLLLLLLHLLLTIPFASWRGGAFDAVINKFSKGVIISLLIVFVVTSVKELRRLLYIQCASISSVVLLSIIAHHSEGGRLMGIQKGILENPNDLAINAAINFPLCLAFMLAARGGARRAFWGIGLVSMMYAVVATYSRSGLIAMVISCLICLWEFGLKGRRPLFLVAAGLVALAGIGVMVGTRNYLIRIESMWEGNIKGSLDRGSLDARQELLKTSLKLMVQHPVFGIGPGNFPLFSPGWGVAHNTYTEIGAEAGIPALLLFLLFLALSVRKVKRVRKLPGYKENPDIRLWATAFWAGIAAYMAGAMFASTEYTLFPYFLVGYICALHNIAKTSKLDASPLSKITTSSKGDLPYGVDSERQLAWNR